MLKHEDDYGMYFPLAVKILGEEYNIYTNNARGGYEFHTICPFCQKRRFSVNLDTGISKCWSAKCSFHGKGGKFAWFVSVLRGVSMKEAEEIIAKEVNVGEILEDIYARNERTVQTATSQLHDEFRVELPDEKRTNSEDKMLMRWLTQGRHSPWTKNEATYILDHFPIYRSQTRGFQDRAVFEITSLNRRAYLGYTTRSDSFLKTINPPNAVLSKMLFNYNEIKDSEEILYVCEGIFSALRVIATGRSAVCTFGVALSIHQALLLDHCASKDIVFLYDNDAAVQAQRNAEYMAKYFTNKRYSWHAIKEDGKDPDDLGTLGCHNYLSDLEETRPVRAGKGFNLNLI